MAFLVQFVLSSNIMINGVKRRFWSTFKLIEMAFLNHSSNKSWTKITFAKTLRLIDKLLEYAILVQF